MERGGAEKVLTVVANRFDSTKFEVIIGCLKKKGELLGMLNHEIQVIDINQPRPYFIFFKLRRIIKANEIDIVCGWMGHINAILSFFRFLLPGKVTLLGRESSIPSRWLYNYRWPGLFRFFYKFYNRMDGIICQSASMQKDLIDNFNVRPGKTIIINNPVAFSNNEYTIPWKIRSFMEGAEKLLLFVGRFSKEKKVGLLLRVMQFLPDSYKLLLVGYGPDENEIIDSITELSLKERTMMDKNCNNPLSYYYRADCLVLCSEFEGYPNVILEAISSGCPVVVYNTFGGAKEMINSDYGIYIDPAMDKGVDFFAEMIEKVCTQDYNRKKISISAKERYDPHKIVKIYEDYFISKRIL